MTPNPFLGVLFHWLGGLASGSFYVPYRQVRKWSWETYWLVGGFFSWIICPWLLAGIITNDLMGVLSQQSMSTLWWTYFFGAMWGMGGLTFGLTMRYLGMSLGMGVALGYCAAVGTLALPIVKAFVNLPALAGTDSIVKIAATTSGQVTLAGVGVCLLGIAIAAMAGLTKEREMPEEEKKKSVAEFNFSKGILIATFSGVMRMAFAMTAGAPIAEASLRAHTGEYWTGLPKLVVILLGGFTTNVIWCVLLNIKNRSGYQYFASEVKAEHAHHGGEGGGEHGGGVAVAAQPVTDLRIPMLRNYFFSALAGATWYFQFFFYSMGETQMGKYGFASWTLHMASIIIFSTMWGVFYKEWKGSSKKAHRLIASGIAALILSTIIIGGGTWLKDKDKANEHPAAVIPSSH